MSPQFLRATEFVLTLEGSYSNDPHDPGKATHWGISKRSYPDVDIEHLTKEDALDIYHRDFWLAMSCPRLPPPLALMVYDASVNQGIHAATLDLQATLGVTVDGVIGPETHAAMALATTALLTPLAARRAMRYAIAPNLTRYGHGWYTRLFRVYRACLEETA